jgi:hypothetical protein
VAEDDVMSDPSEIPTNQSLVPFQTSPYLLPPSTMTRQFFVGGNFKMNPASRDAKRSLIKTLNEATLDPSTGEPYLTISTLLDLTIQPQRSSLHPLPCM